MKNNFENSLNILRETGFQSYESRLVETIRHEVSINNGRLDLLRTLEDVSLTLTGILNGSRASTTITRCDENAVLTASQEILKLSESTPPDSANEIAPLKEACFREKGPSEVDVTVMIHRLAELKSYCSEKYPILNLRRATLEFKSQLRRYGNSNGTMLSERHGIYTFTLTFVSAEGGERSSFNYTSVQFDSLDKPLQLLGNIDTLLKQSTGQLFPEKLHTGFTGDVIITPECMGYFLYLLSMHLQDGYLVKGTSLYQDSIDEKAADSKFTFRTAPVSDELPHSRFITEDGFPAADITVIEKGVLRSYLLSLYGANKTGYHRSGNQGGFCIIEPGETALEEMISSIERGLFITRFSGGMPGENGDFSGVAKNSYLIENGQISKPVSEVMISMNLKNMFSSIRHLSRERTNLGSSLLPWIQFSDISVHGWEQVEEKR